MSLSPVTEPKELEALKDYLDHIKAIGDMICLAGVMDKKNTGIWKNIGEMISGPAIEALAILGVKQPPKLEIVKLDDRRKKKA